MEGTYRFVTLPNDSVVWPAAGAFAARGGARVGVICSIAVVMRYKDEFWSGRGDKGGRVSTKRDGRRRQRFEHAFERVFHEHHVSDYGIGEVSATESQYQK